MCAGLHQQDYGHNDQWKKYFQNREKIFPNFQESSRKRSILQVFGIRVRALSFADRLGTYGSAVFCVSGSTHIKSDYQVTWATLHLTKVSPHIAANHKFCYVVSLTSSLV